MNTRLTVELYFEGLDTGDVSQIPLDKKVRFVGPMVPEGVYGEGSVRELLSEVAAGLKNIVVPRIFIDGEHSCAPFEFVFLDDKLPRLLGVDCFRVVDGKIVEIQPFYDPRPLISG